MRFLAAFFLRRVSGTGLCGHLLQVAHRTDAYSQFCFAFLCYLNLLFVSTNFRNKEFTAESLGGDSAEKYGEELRQSKVKSTLACITHNPNLPSYF